MKKPINLILVVITFFLSIYANSQSRNGDSFRIGIGMGYNYYLGDQMDYKITSSFGNFNENRTGKTIAFYKSINNKWELGAFARDASMMTLKSENTQGLECIFQDVQLTTQYSFNENINLNKSSTTINATFGLGIINFQSRYFEVEPISGKEMSNFTTIGFGIQNGFSGSKHDPNKVTAVTGHVGLNIGFRISKNINFYLENNFNLTTTNKLSGNLFKYSWIPPDGYWYSGIALYIRFNKKEAACPRFF